MAITLLDNDTSTGSAAEVTGGQFLFRVESAGFNGATIQLQIQGPGPSAAWIDVVDATFTANGATRVFLPGGSQARAEISVATPSSGVYSDLTHFGV